jgi:hypothetical protein
MFCNNIILAYNNVIFTVSVVTVQNRKVPFFQSRFASMPYFPLLPVKITKWSINFNKQQITTGKNNNNRTNGFIFLTVFLKKKRLPPFETALFQIILSFVSQR